MKQIRTFSEDEFTVKEYKWIVMKHLHISPTYEIYIDRYYDKKYQGKEESCICIKE